MDIEIAKKNIGKKVVYTANTDKELEDHLGFVGYGTISSIYDHIYVGVKNISGSEMYFKSSDIDIMGKIPNEIILDKNECQEFCEMIEKAKREKFKLGDRVYADVIAMFKDGAHRRSIDYLYGSHDLEVCDLRKDGIEAKNKIGEVFLIPQKYLEHIPKCMIDSHNPMLDKIRKRQVPDETIDEIKKWLLNK